MLRPATPLSIIFFVAFVLLLLSTLSTPVIKGVPLGAYQGYNFGVLGYCHDNGRCVGPRIGYSTDGLFSGGNDGEFTLDSSTRTSLSSILIVHPIAALLTLICFGLAVAAHFHGPSHSPRYLLALLILTFPTLLITLLAFLVDILLFVPHMQWGGWIVLGATICIIGSSIVTCAMRRTLVSRKARKKRIAENADMNGQAYYENLAANRLMVDSLPKAESPPPMSGSTVVDKNGQQYATFEMKRQETHTSDTGPNSFQDDRVPLNPTRDPSIRSTSTSGRRRHDYGDIPPLPRPSQESGMHRQPSRDEYGNPIANGAAMGMGAAGLRHQNSQGSLGSERSNGYQRGRGRGYGPPPRGYYGGPPRGNYHGPSRGGGYGPRGRGGPGMPPPGFRGRGRGGFYGGPPPDMGRGGPARPMPPPSYAADPYYGAPRSQSPPMDNNFVAMPDMPIGQAIEMDERTGSAQSRQPFQNNAYGLRDSDGDVMGMVNLQQGNGQPPSPRRDENSQPMRSPTSAYSEPREYVPPRQQWAPSPLSATHAPPAQIPEASRATFESTSSDPYSSNANPSSGALPLNSIPASPTSVSGHRSPVNHHRARAGSETYYEDVDPRFAQDPVPEPQQSVHPAHRESGLPGALTPGPAPQAPPTAYSNGPYRMNSPPPIAEEQYLRPAEAALGPDGRPTTDHSNSDSSLDHSRQQRQTHALSITPPDNASATGGSDAGHVPGYLEPIPDGARSPGEASESSHFTSVSQRGINPNWRPGMPMAGPGYGPPGASGVTSASAAQRRKEDVILSANPDFSLPGVGLSSRGVGRGRGRGGVNGGVPPATGLTPAGRYPTGVPMGDV